MNQDVLIVGGGPLGCATALHLSSRGMRSTILEERAYPRDKVCGEGLLPHGVLELETLGLQREVLAAGVRFDGIAYQGAGGRVEGLFRGLTRHDFGIGIRRLALDALFAEQVRKNPRIRLLRAKANAIKVDGDGVTVATDSAEHRSRALVGADGLHSFTRKALGLEKVSRKNPRYGARMHLQLPSNRAQPHLVEVHLGEGCELYITPVAEHVVNMAVLAGRDITQTFRGDLAAGLMDLVRRQESAAHWLQDAQIISEPALCGPLRQETTDVVANRALLVGDAAGFLDPLTGEGMSLGLMMARIAAETLAKGLQEDKLSAVDLRSYAERCRANTADVVQATELLLWWSRQPRLRKYFVRNLAKNPQVFEAILAVLAGATPLRGFGWANLRKLLLRI